MIPWDFGLINAIKKELNFAIFPSNPPEEFRKTPYLIFELKNIFQGMNLQVRVEFIITIVDSKEITGAGFDVLRAIHKIIENRLVLSQGNCTIGSARIKAGLPTCKANIITLNLVAILQLNAIYEDEDENAKKNGNEDVYIDVEKNEETDE